MSASEPDPVAITGSWEEHHENRILALKAKYAAEDPAYGKGARGNRGRGGVPAAVQRAASALAVSVLAYRPGVIGLVSVLCPHCGGRRTVTASNLHTWEVQRAVPACVKGVKPSCEPHPEGATHGR